MKKAIIFLLMLATMSKTQLATVKPTRPTQTAVKLVYNDMSKQGTADTAPDIPYTTDQVFLKCSLSTETQKPLFLNCGLWEK